MPTARRNILLKILIILISMTLIGFQNVPANANPGLVEENGSWSPGYVELLVYGEGSEGVVTYVWYPTEFFMPITSFDSRGNGEFQGEAMTHARTNTKNGPLVGFSLWPVHWKITGRITPPPECALKLIIDETWFPGINIMCEPTGVVGCISEAWPAGYFPGVEFTIPFDRAWGSPVPTFGANGMPIHLTAIVTSIAYGDLTGGIQPLGCENNLWFPVIPQAP